MNVLAIDPGSTSTKIGIYHQQNIVKESFTHDRCEVEKYLQVSDQQAFRVDCIQRYLDANGFGQMVWDAVVGRGGLMKPVSGGVIAVNQALLDDLTIGINGHHASNLGGLMAYQFAQHHQCPAFVVDPVVVDEMLPVAKLSGFEGIQRKSIFHALNQKAMARQVSEDILNRSYCDINLIVAHMGGGITVGAHQKGKVVDVNDGLSGDGPFAPERTGGLPVRGVLELIRDGKYTPEELLTVASRKGGVFSYLEIVDVKELVDLSSSDKDAALVLDGMIYQIAKEIGALAAALSGDVDGIVLTGGIAHSDVITDRICEKVQFIADVFVKPGEHEIEALVAGALRVLNGDEEANTYG